MASTQAAVLLALLLAIGMILTVLSCALQHNWLPFISVVFYALAPIPQICGRKEESYGFGDDENSFADASQFITGALVVGGLGLPLTLAHAEAITHQAMYLNIFGGLLIFSTVFLYDRLLGGSADMY